ncbi:MAG: hypothetical protein RLZZ09_2050, partial [Pseudomonadota bacterium]
MKPVKPVLYPLVVACLALLAAC